MKQAQNINSMKNQTIFALATPQGRSAVQIIRISGTKAGDVVRILTGNLPKARFAKFAPITGQKGEVIDHGVILFFKAPASATGEDLAEFHIHGSPVIADMMLNELGAMEGVRLAEAGEFSRRAFLNGKMNLDQAEGIADLIDADTTAQHRQAIRQIDGALSEVALRWRQDIITISAEMAALIDFADEELPPDMEARLKQTIKKLIAEMAEHLSGASRGLILRDGFNVIIMGRPNAGKSTLLNALCGEDRAIVTSEAGTTRDLIHARLDVGGVAVNLTDTAGIRHNAGAIESEGVRRATEAAVSAQLVIMLIAADEDNPKKMLKELQGELAKATENRDFMPVIVPVLNKIDLMPINDADYLKISAKNGAGLENLWDAIKSAINEAAPPLEAPILTRKRHITAVQSAHDALSSSLALDMAAEPELLADELQQAANAIGRISGRVDVEDLLDHIFSHFCIGK